MAKAAEFSGFSKETLQFFDDLKNHNNKEWFTDNRSRYDDYVLEPAKDFVLAMGERLKELSPKVVADPRVNQSIFRINRDIRFSKDKSPYKTYLGLWFWEGSGKKMECSGYYFQLDPPNIMLGVGLYGFSKNQLAEYRRSLLQKRYAASLLAAVDALPEKGYEIGGRHYKRVPRGIDTAHQMASWLKHNGLYVGIETCVPRIFTQKGFVDYCFRRYQNMKPIHDWLLLLTRRAGKTSK